MWGQGTQITHTGCGGGNTDHTHAYEYSDAKTRATLDSWHSTQTHRTQEKVRP